ncbi:MAG: protein kinase domain-containing protein [Pyrinomonadaceae bacterium]
MVYCPECGLEISPADVFCGNCGIALTPIVPLGGEAKDAPISEDEAQENAIESAHFDSTGEAEKAVPPIKSAEKENSQLPEKDFQNAENKSAEPIEDFPPKPAILENLKADEPKTVKTSDEKTSDSFRQVAENLTSKTELVDIPANYFSEKSQSENFSAETNAAKNSVGQNDFVARSETAEKDKTQNSSQPFEPEKVQTPQIETIDAESVNRDFETTIPYVPADFDIQSPVDTNLSGENPPELLKSNKLSVSDSEKFAVGEDAAPIEPPDIPVGSSMHDSLEPTSISVQIYDPKENVENSESETIIKSTGDVKSAAPEQQEKPPAAKAMTSPNIGFGDTDGKGKAKLKPLDEGAILNNRYEIIRKIGGGGMGAVYLASDRNLGGVSRAVKEMVQSYIEDAQQEKAVNDFRRESMLLTSLEHPSIPTIYDYFFDEKEARFYLVMKYISGGDLCARLRSAPEGRIDEATVTEWAIQLADVLDYLHNRQPPIVYRDLKPSNIMIDGNTGKVMLIDFGIARWVNKEEKGVTAVGTMGYAPPELFSGNVEPRSDIYSLGSTMFHLLTGADPQSNPLLIFDFQKNPRPRQINPQLTDQMEQILMKTVEYSANKRFNSAAELRDALVKHLNNLKSGKVTVGAADGGAAHAPAVNQLVFCGFCGQKILASDVFCPFCGAQQTVGGQIAPPAFAAPPKSTARLVIIGTSELDSPVFKLEKDNNLVGRRDPLSNIFPEVDLSKFDPQTKISRRHARIWRERDSFMLEDLGSSNGTILTNNVNESQKLSKNQPRVLSHGDKIRVGDTTLYFVYE